MDFKDPKSQKIILGVLLGFLALYFWHNRIYSKNNQKIQAKETQYESILTNLKNVELKAKSFENLKSEYESLLERYKTVELLLPEEKQVPLLLTQMHQGAQTSGITIREIAPRATYPLSFYNASDFSIQMTGNYHEFGNFLSRIANFPFIANISDLNLTSGLSAGKKKETVQATFKMTTYFIKEEERLKKVQF
ncbi:MAG: hypothetical protein A2145_00795 [candidate division Zixibacteria bacterium RBG_16_40_9]|nr:MAG: hypothetical protein A2145_00795 [candidate division Zixibacteria bacterium RBG_16_40_9]